MKQISKKDKEIPILSFFTGLGLLDLGFHQAGFQSIWHNEIDKHFVKGFEHGMNAYHGTGINVWSILCLNGRMENKRIEEKKKKR